MDAEGELSGILTFELRFSLVFTGVVGAWKALMHFSTASSGLMTWGTFEAGVEGTNEDVISALLVRHTEKLLWAQVCACKIKTAAVSPRATN